MFKLQELTRIVSTALKRLPNILNNQIIRVHK